MKRATMTGTVGLVLAGFVLNVSAGAKGNPYEIIVARNPFGLRPIPVAEPLPPPVTPSPPMPEIRITGITTLLGAPRATFQYEDKEAKKTEFPPLLAEGETYKMLSVIRIDPENGRVQITNGDTEMVLDFIANGVKPLATAMAAAGSPANSASTGFVPNPGGRAIVTGPAPAQTLPPAVLERMKQLQRAQAEQALHSRILPTPGLGDSLSPAQ